MRYLSLILILSLASTANAYILLYLDDSPAPSGVELAVDEVLTIQIYSSDASSWLGYIIREEGGVGNLYNLKKLWEEEPPPIEPYPDFIEPGWGEGYELDVDWLSVPPQAGIQFTVDYSSSVTGTAVVSLWDDRIGYNPEDVADALNITVVPEPCTVLLLGLGSLTVLKRRRR